MLCPKCQNRVAENAKFCDQCGIQLEKRKINSLSDSLGKESNYFTHPELTPQYLLKNIRTYLGPSILVMIFFSRLFGLIAFSYAIRTHRYIHARDYYYAQMSSKKAKKWCIISLLFGIILDVVYLIIAAKEHFR